MRGQAQGKSADAVVIDARQFQQQRSEGDAGQTGGENAYDGQSRHASDFFRYRERDRDGDQFGGERDFHQPVEVEQQPQRQRTAGNHQSADQHRKKYRDQRAPRLAQVFIQRNRQGHNRRSEQKVQRRGALKIAFIRESGDLQQHHQHNDGKQHRLV